MKIQVELTEGEQREAYRAYIANKLKLEIKELEEVYTASGIITFLVEE